ncbi:MAG: nucleoside monophosphate kinase [Luteolibacter sp.]|nr:nucleoside monophosphate kinase [Luteolibacter sp.]
MSESKARSIRIVLLGPPASGKGTQGRRLAANFGLGYFSTGALLREQVENTTPLGKIAGPILERGEYLPDDLMCRILAGWLERQTGGWVLDGFPRSLPQALFLGEWLAAHHQQLDAAVLLDVPYEELASRIRHRVECPDCRWSGQDHQTVRDDRCPVCATPAVPRADDSEQNFARRHQEFMRHTQPAISFYQDSDLLIRCDATAPQDEVSAKLLQLLVQ